jgi:hypothetical protein
MLLKHGEMVQVECPLFEMLECGWVQSYYFYRVWDICIYIIRYLGYSNKTQKSFMFYMYLVHMA